MKQSTFNLLIKLSFLLIGACLLLLLINIYGDVSGMDVLGLSLSLGVIGIIIFLVASKFPPLLEIKSRMLRLEFALDKPFINIKELSWSDGMCLQLPDGASELKLQIDIEESFDAKTGSIVETRVNRFVFHPILEPTNIDFSANPYAGDSDLLLVASTDVEESEINKALNENKNNANPVFIKRRDQFAGMIVGMGGNYITLSSSPMGNHFLLEVSVGPYSPKPIKESSL